MAKLTAMSSIAYGHYTLYQAIPRMAERGFKRIEIGSFYDYCYHFNSGSPTPPELNAMLAEYDLTPVALNWSPMPSLAYDPDSVKLWLNAFRSKIVQAAEVGFSMMTMHFGERNDRDDQESQLATAARTYHEIAQFASDYNVRMLLEVPHAYNIHWNTEAVFELFDQIASQNIGALVDSSHWGSIGYDLDPFLDRLGDRLCHIHLRDAKGPGEPACRDTLTLTPGTGVVDFTKLSRSLDRIGYTGEVTAELEYFDMTLGDIEHQYDLGLQHLANAGWELPQGVKY
jgi:sugar phosphate isomerase/epimerase